MVLATLLGARSADAQTQIVIAPSDYQVVTIVESVVITNCVWSPFVPATLNGGEALEFVFRLPQAMGVDLTATSFVMSRTLISSNSNGGTQPSFLVTPTVRYFDSAAGELTVFAAARSFGEFYSLFGTNQIAVGSLNNTLLGPYNAVQATIGEIRMSATVPSFFSATALTARMEFCAYRNRSSATEPVPTLIVKGITGIALQSAVASITADLVGSGVNDAAALAIATDLTDALSGVQTGDNRVAAAELTAVRNVLEQLVSSGELAKAELRELWPKIIQYAAGIRRPQ